MSHLLYIYHIYNNGNQKAFCKHRVQVQGKIFGANHYLRVNVKISSKIIFLSIKNI
jgi:hypothetical protein